MVYFNSRKLCFTSRHKHDDRQAAIHYTSTPDQSSFDDFVQSEDETVCWVSDNPGLQFSQFCRLFHYVEAAGGLVGSPDDHLLFIWRNNRWDLPKGVIHQGELPEEAAIREVREECGLKSVRIGVKLPSTFHVYQTKEHGWVLKKTHWFKMTASRNQKLKPQHEEGITMVKWKSCKRLNHVKNNTYGNIKDLLTSCAYPA